MTKGKKAIAAANRRAKSSGEEAASVRREFAAHRAEAVTTIAALKAQLDEARMARLSDIETAANARFDELVNQRIQAMAEQLTADEVKRVRLEIAHDLHAWIKREDVAARLPAWRDLIDLVGASGGAEVNQLLRGGAGNRTDRRTSAKRARANADMQRQIAGR